MIKRGTSYFGCRDLRHFKEDLSEIQAFPFHYIVLTFSETDVLYYRRTLHDMVSAARDAGLEVYVDPWGVGKVFGGESFSQFVAEYPGECQILTNGQRVPAACLTSQKFQDHMSQWVDQACFLAPDVIFWDEPHYYFNWTQALKNPSTYHLWGCFCARCRRHFKDEMGYAMPALLTAEVIGFRKRILLNFLKRVCQKVHSHEVKNAVCLLPVPDKKFENILAGDVWDEVSQIKEVDILSTDPYPIFLNLEVDPYVGEYSRKVKKLAAIHRKESEVWIQAFRIPKGHEEKVVKCIERAAGCQPNRIAVWSYRATECMSELSCEEPAIVWGHIGDGLLKLE